QSPADVRRLAQRFVEVLEEKERRAIVRGDEIESGTRAEQLAAATIVAAHALGEAPYPERDRRRETCACGVAQQRHHALLFRGLTAAPSALAVALPPDTAKPALAVYIASWKVLPLGAVASANTG